MQVLGREPSGAQQIQVGQAPPVHLGQRESSATLMVSAVFLESFVGLAVVQDEAQAGARRIVGVFVVRRGDEVVRPPHQLVAERDVPVDARAGQPPQLMAQPVDGQHALGQPGQRAVVQNAGGLAAVLQGDVRGGERLLQVAAVLQQRDPFSEADGVVRARVLGGQFVRAARGAVGVEERGAVQAALPGEEFVRVPRVPHVARRRPVELEQNRPRIGGGHRAEPQRQPLRGTAGGDDLQGGAPLSAVLVQHDHAVGLDQRLSAPLLLVAGQVPAQQVGREVAQIVLQRLGDGRALPAGHLGQVEGDVDAGGGAGAPPVPGQAPFRRLLDHPAGHRVPAGPRPHARAYVVERKARVGARFRLGGGVGFAHR
ncbi:hypothetical protein [Actinomadura keratinilytica]|uniref:hypothetical protein n=1 Tax=Actinomadura keratinilytica TaxID=547461 RepID=UPI003617BD7A